MQSGWRQLRGDSGPEDPAPCMSHHDIRCAAHLSQGIQSAAEYQICSQTADSDGFREEPGAECAALQRSGQRSRATVIGAEHHLGACMRAPYGCDAICGVSLARAVAAGCKPSELNYSQLGENPQIVRCSSKGLRHISCRSPQTTGDALAGAEVLTASRALVDL